MTTPTIEQLMNRIDEQKAETEKLINERLAAVPAGQQVGIGAGDAVEQLAEDHARPLRRVAPRSAAAGEAAAGATGAGGALVTSEHAQS